jgi:hypothetical protein
LARVQKVFGKATQKHWGHRSIGHGTEGIWKGYTEALGAQEYWPGYRRYLERLQISIRGTGVLLARAQKTFGTAAEKYWGAQVYYWPGYIRYLERPQRSIGGQEYHWPGHRRYLESCRELLGGHRSTGQGTDVLDRAHIGQVTEVLERLQKYWAGYSEQKY